ncbi:MAG: UDP-3-O-acyl-N-acetylglucosamine deacetylase [candidate division WOR-3 bacterium]|jgi:UDP-3-O-[3-hydroxymyristoyl] N-acetylglucosamine deacetylase/3-hydroxyacyl-[acyl-carrier-protein] dehydratase
MKSKTIKDKVVFEGYGIHTNSFSKLILEPYENGIVFLKDNVEIPLNLEYISQTQRRIVLKKDNVQIETIEHLLSVLNVLGIFDIKIVLEGDEIPILDGSSVIFFEKIKEIGLVELEKEILEFKLLEPIEFYLNDSYIYAKPSEKFIINYAIVYENHSFLKSQFFRIEINEENYYNDVARARTYAFEEEVNELRSKGLGKGGNLENALIISKNGYLNEPRFLDEPVRHKILDLIGDLMFLNRPFIGEIFCIKGSHKLHIEFVKKLLNDGLGGPIIDINEIKSLIPHRYPFLLVDKVVHLDENKIVAYKNVSINEEFFNGHFPNYPIMPGVLIVEALAQTGAIWYYKFNPDNRDKLPLFIGIEDVKFKNQVLPGDKLYLEIRVLRSGSRFIKMYGRAWTERGICCEGSLIATIK